MNIQFKIRFTIPLVFQATIILRSSACKQNLRVGQFSNLSHSSRYATLDSHSWNSRKFIADGPAIMNYLNETIEENNFKDLIKFNMHIESASWNSVDSLWELSINTKLDKLEIIKTKFIQMCAGYYSYKSGHKPIFKGSEDRTNYSSPRVE